MRYRTRSILTILSLLFCSLSMSSTATAAGLVVFDGTGTARNLAQLGALDVAVTLTDGHADVVETRRYSLDAVSANETVRFYRSLSPSAEPASYELFVDGQRLPATVNPAERGTSLQTQLFEELREPGILRGVGGPLAESAALGLAGEGYVSLEVRVEYREELTRWDTMRALDLPIDWQERAVGSMNVNVTAETEEPLRALYSPFHGLDVTRDSTSTAHAFYNGWEVCTTNNLVLLMSTGTDDLHLDLLPFRYSDVEGGFFMALLTPSLSGEAIARDIVFAIDTSGSMDGQKMVQARDALKGVIAGLSSKDRFTVVEFDNDVNVLNDTAQSASRDFIDDANLFVDGLVADGATNISDALRTSFDALPFSNDRPRYIVLLTDGQPTEGETDTDAILEIARLRNEVGARLFAFGIGNDVNTVLLDRLALDSSGDAIYIRPGQDVVGPVEEFFASIASAALVNPSLDASAFGVSAVYPESLPDLYADQTIAILGRYDTGGVGEIVLRGVQGSHELVTRYEVELPEFSTRNGHVPRVWATRHVGTLLHAIKLGDADRALPVEATAIAARFGVITEFTNFVLDENGNAVMRYTDVPLDVTGSVAVDTSSSLDGYQQTGSASMRFENFVRYAGDRTLPTYDGWFTDSSTPRSPDWIDIHFGSALYMDLVARESASGITSLLAVSRDVAFEFHGRELRVSDPADEERDLPAEASTIPVAQNPEAGQASVRIRVQEFGTGAGGGSGGDNPEDGKHGLLGPVYGGGGCSTAAGTSPSLLLLLLAFVFGRTRRRFSR